MTRDEMIKIYEQSDPFDLINHASASVRPPVVREWLDYSDIYRPVYSLAWAAMMGDSVGFEADSPIDGLAHGAFAEGWHVALCRVGQMLGVAPETFRDAICLAGELGADALTGAALEALRKIRPYDRSADDVGRFYGELTPLIEECAHNARMDGGEPRTAPHLTQDDVSVSPMSPQD